MHVPGCLCQQSHSTRINVTYGWSMAPFGFKQDPALTEGSPDAAGQPHACCARLSWHIVMALNCHLRTSSVSLVFNYKWPQEFWMLIGLTLHSSCHGVGLETF